MIEKNRTADLNSTTLPIEEQMDKLRLKCLMDLVELSKKEKDWNQKADMFKVLDQ